MKNAIYIENGYAEVATTHGWRFHTVRLHEGQYVRIDDGDRYPQLCAGAARRGATLEYTSPEQLARDCDATLYKTRAGFERAAERLAQAEPWMVEG